MVRVWDSIEIEDITDGAIEFGFYTDMINMPVLTMIIRDISIFSGGQWEFGRPKQSNIVLADGTILIGEYWSNEGVWHFQLMRSKYRIGENTGKPVWILIGDEELRYMYEEVHRWRHAPM